ncbi:MAG TPA: hypothetical protein PKD20_01045 [Candidatus Saccharibacteria bacterium]|nr:hypothetical protein [Candidatus Saccharibacteria bacterium]HMT55442.1 hypothetical protein [Candidatus Saccharibacteria bacterium]
MTVRTDEVRWAAYLVNQAETLCSEFYSQRITYSVAAGQESTKTIDQHHRFLGKEIAHAAFNIDWGNLK